MLSACPSGRVQTVPGACLVAGQCRQLGHHAGRRATSQLLLSRLISAELISPHRAKGQERFWAFKGSGYEFKTK